MIYITTIYPDVWCWQYGARVIKDGMHPGWLALSQNNIAVIQLWCSYDCLWTIKKTRRRITIMLDNSQSTACINGVSEPVISPGWNTPCPLFGRQEKQEGREDEGSQKQDGAWFVGGLSDQIWGLPKVIRKIFPPTRIPTCFNQLNQQWD